MFIQAVNIIVGATALADLQYGRGRCWFLNLAWGIAQMRGE
jgi:hypothetical protein